MLNSGLAEQEADQLQLTLLGKACGRSSLSFESSLRLVELLRKRDLKQLKSDDLVALLQVLQEADDVYTPLMKRGTAESIRITDAYQRFDAGVVQALQHFASETADYWARCKRAAVLWDWMHGISVEEIERYFSSNPFQGRISYGDIRRFADATRFHLRSAQQIIAVLVTDDTSLLTAIDATLKCLEIGIPRECLALLDLPIALNRGQYLALYETGAKTPEAICSLQSAQLIRLLGERTAQELEKRRSALTDLPR
jgi:hypothetical protein